MRIFSGNANREFAEEVAKHVGISLGDVQVDRFNDGECNIQINENIRNGNVFVIQVASPFLFPEVNYMLSFSFSF